MRGLTTVNETTGPREGLPATQTKDRPLDARLCPAAPPLPPCQGTPRKTPTVGDGLRNPSRRSGGDDKRGWERGVGGLACVTRGLI